MQARKTWDYFQEGFSRNADVRTKVCLWSNEEWDVEGSVCDLRIPHSPPILRRPCLQLDQNKLTCYVPLSELQSAELDRPTPGGDSCRARLTLRNWTKLTGTLSGHLDGQCEFGRISIPWTAMKTISLNSVHAGENDSLAIHAKGELTLQDGSRRPFNSWAPVLGDVMLDVLLTETGRGPQVFPLSDTNHLEVLGQDKNGFFWQFYIRSSSRNDKITDTFIGLTYILISTEQGILRIPAEEIRSIVWG